MVPKVRLIRVAPQTPPESRVSIEMDVKTAEAILAIYYHIGGDLTGPRGKLDELSNALERAGVVMPGWHSWIRFEGNAMYLPAPLPVIPPVLTGQPMRRGAGPACAFMSATEVLRAMEPRDIGPKSVISQAIMEGRILPGAVMEPPIVRPRGAVAAAEVRAMELRAVLPQTVKSVESVAAMCGSPELERCRCTIEDCDICKAENKVWTGSEWRDANDVRPNV